MGQRLHFGERMELHTRQDGPGSFPGLRRLSSGWSDGNTGNLCIGQDPVWVTPIQIAVLASAIANGGNVLWPRLVDRVRNAGPDLSPGDARCLPSRSGAGSLGRQRKHHPNHARGYAG